MALIEDIWRIYNNAIYIFFEAIMYLHVEILMHLWRMITGEKNKSNLIWKNIFLKQ